MIVPSTESYHQIYHALARQHGTTGIRTGRKICNNVIIQKQQKHQQQTQQYNHLIDQQSINSTNHFHRQQITIYKITK